MRFLVPKAILISIALLFALSLFGQDKYLAPFSATKAENYYWKSTAPNHTDSEVPEKWKDKSAVILNSSLEIQLGRSDIRPFNLVQNLITHKRIKIQDKAAVENFSEMYFDSRDDYGYVGATHWGVKLIKESGEEVILDMEKEAVEIPQSNTNSALQLGHPKSKDKSYNDYKLAIPNLEVGDIIDVYRYSQINMYYSEYTRGYYLWYEKVRLQGDYPVKNFEMKLNLADHFKVYYLPVNGAPELTTKKKGDGYNFSFLATDIDESKAANWNFPYQDNPYFILAIRIIVGGLESTKKDVGKPYVFELEEEDIVERYTSTYEPDRDAKNEFSEFNRFLKQKEITPKNNKEKFGRYFYFLRHKFLNKHTIYQTYNKGELPYNQISSRILDHMLTAADLMDLEYDVLLVQKRSNGKINDILFSNNFYDMLRIKMDGEYVYMYEGGHFAKYDEIPGTIAGSQAYAISSKTGKSSDIELEKIVLPVSGHKDNLTSHNLTLDLSEGLQNPASASLQVTVKGRAADDYKEDMLNIFDYVLDENRYYNTKLWGSEEHHGKDKTMMLKLNQIEKDLLKEREKVLISRAETLFGTEEVSVNNVKIHSNGNLYGEDDFNYSYEIAIEEGLLKKAGPNFILEAGKLVGGQIEVTDDEKERTEDIYMPYARSFDYDITIKIPAGYTVEGLDKFNKKIENATGGTISSATQNGDSVQLKFYKYYKHNYEKVENWPQMIEFLDAGYQFTQEKLLFRKG